jgi:hypothetical protein
LLGSVSSFGLGLLGLRAWDAKRTTINKNKFNNLSSLQKNVDRVPTL